MSAYDTVLKSSKMKSVYDPFCGGGVWLCAFLLKTKFKYNKNATLPIYGTDIDKNAVFLARLNLQILLNEASSDLLRKLCDNLKVTNTLYQSNDDSQIIEKYLKNCSFVATNPPYGFAIQTNNSNFKSTLDRVPDKEVFYYAVDKVRTQLAIEKPAFFLVPNTFLFNLGSKDFKRHLTERFDIAVHDHTKENLFATATVRTALLTLSKKEDKKLNVIYSLGFNDKARRVARLDFIEGRMKPASENSGISKLETIPLGSMFEVSQGLIPYDKYRGHSPEQIKNRVYHSASKKSSEYKKELQGKNVAPFSVEWNGENWIKYGDWLAAPRAPKFFKLSRVLIREITDSKSGQIHCAYTEQEFYNTPSIINVVCKADVKNSQRALKTLAVLISSSYYSDHHLKTSPKANKGVFPKILVNDVRNLPLPVNFNSLDLTSVYDKAEKIAAKESVQAAIDYVNSVVTELFAMKRAA